MALFISYFVLFLHLIYVARSITKCDKKSACSCMGDKGMVDLSPLAGNGGPKFKDVTATTGDQFSWNPCTAFTEGDCKNVAACQIQGGSNYFSIGTEDSAKFEVKSGALTLSYSADTFVNLGLGFLRTAIITLVCDETEEGQLMATGESPPSSGKYLMTLNSKYACEKTHGGGGDITITTGLSPGSILLVVVFPSALVYLIAGIAIQMFVRKAEGKEIVPNVNFWTALPGLIRDGILFVVRCGKTGKKYDQI